MGESSEGVQGPLFAVLRSKSCRNNTKKRTTDRKVVQKLGTKKVYLAKIDIADGFYRVWLQADDVLKLGVGLPTHPQGVPLIAFPLALPIGWVESPHTSLPSPKRSAIWLITPSMTRNPMLHAATNGGRHIASNG
ncbi:hypothetical protein MHU86_15147 [Fragilaria crotonensis]|nr:hypothetical protein MHU86_15147 [Fragilaria crotonensis]